jgi:hypothetical protein
VADEASPAAALVLSAFVPASSAVAVFLSSAFAFGHYFD